MAGVDGRAADVRRGICGALVLLLLPCAALAQGWLAQGGQFEVNGTTASDQILPAVAVAGDGSFVVVWESFTSPGDDASSRSIQARRYSAAGTPLGAQFQVNTTTAEEQKTAAVAMNAAGAFVVAWESDVLAGAGTDFEIRARLYNSAGNPTGPDFPVHAASSQEQLDPAAAMRGDGEFTLVWESDTDPGVGSNFDIVARSFSAAGAPLAAEQVLNTTTASTQQNPAVAANADGDRVVVWQSSTSPGGDAITESIQARYAVTGLAFGSQFQVNLDAPVVGDFSPAAAVAPDGGFVVAWESNGSLGGDGSLASIQARRYDAGATPLTVAIQVNNFTPDAQRFPSVAIDALGRFVTAFQSYGSAGGDNSEWSVQVRALEEDGGGLGASTQANGFTSGQQAAAAVAMTGAGAIVVAWESLGSPGVDNSGYSIQARRYILPGLFADGFESGNTARWSFTLP